MKHEEPQQMTLSVPLRGSSKPTGTCDFDWFDETDEHIIVKPRRGVAVYLNPKDEIVVRQQHHDLALSPADDPHVNLPIEQADLVADEIRGWIEDLRERRKRRLENHPDRPVDVDDASGGVE